MLILLLEKHIFNGNILDNIVSNDDNIHGLSIKDRTGLSDHLPLLLNYCNALNKSCDVESFQHSFSNYQHHINFETTWRSFNFNNYTCGENVDDFCSFLAWSIDTCFPRKRKIQMVSPFYYSPHTIHCLNKLNTAKRYCSKNPTRLNLQQLKSLEEDYTQSIELDNVVFVNGSLTSTTDQCFALLNSLKDSPIPNHMFFNSKAIDEIEVPKLFNNLSTSSFNDKVYDVENTVLGDNIKLEHVLIFFC